MTQPSSKIEAGESLAGSHGSAAEGDVPRTQDIDVVAEIKLPIPIKALAAMEKSYSSIYGKGKLYMRQQGEHLQFFKYRTQDGKPPNARLNDGAN